MLLGLRYWHAPYDTKIVIKLFGRRYGCGC